MKSNQELLKQIDHLLGQEGDTQSTRINEALWSLVDDLLVSMKREIPGFRADSVRRELAKAVGGDISTIFRERTGKPTATELYERLQESLLVLADPLPTMYCFGEHGVSISRPDDALLMNLLLSYRKSRYGLVQENRMRLGIYAAIDYQAQGIARKYSLSETQAEDLVGRAKNRVENKLSANGALLPDYDPEAGASIYSFLWRATDNIARNILDESRVSLDESPLDSDSAPLEDLSVPCVSDVEDAAVADRDGRSVRRYVSLDELCGTNEQLPDALVSHDETPVVIRGRKSAIRITEQLLPLLRKVGAEMPGKIVLHHGKKIRLTLSHKEVWDSYLGLSPTLNRMPECSTKALSQCLELSEATVKRRVSDCFAYFVQHPDFDRIVAAMLPYRITRQTDESRELEMADALAKRIRGFLEHEGDHGKSQFRELVHSWIEEHGQIE